MNKRIVIDQMQRTVELPSTVLRIVSLVPSQTELLVHLGLKDQLVGITKFCVHPEALRREISVVGGTKNVSIEKVRALKPDLIIGNKEENDRENIAELEQIAPVWMSDIYTLEDALLMITEFGLLFQKEQQAETLRNTIADGMERLRNRYASKNWRVTYLIWRNPYLAAGPNTFIHHILEHLGFQNAIIRERYPEVDWKTTQTDLILLSSEPYPFGEKHVLEVQGMFPKAEVLLVDGEYFSWYGSRLAEAISYFDTFLEATEQKEN